MPRSSPPLAAGRLVLCDRYVASTLALQRLDGISIDLLWDMNSEALVPDLSVLLTADVAAIDQRLTERDRVTRFERCPTWLPESSCTLRRHSECFKAKDIER
jgi:dTMP kinase